jgi:CheY-like chemotaxis protein
VSTILLVEDNPDDAELLIYAFGKAGIANRVVLVDDGEKAVNYIHGKENYADRAEFPLPGLILLDLKLPRYSGFEVLEMIRSSDVTRRTPVVVLTSSNQEHDIRRAYDLGANAYLVKPVGGDALTAMMHSLDAFWIQLNRTATS